MEKLVYKSLKEFLKDEKTIVEYLFVAYKLYKKYGKSLEKHIDNIKFIDKKLFEILLFFKEEKYTTSDVLSILLYATKIAKHNIVEVTRHKSITKNDVDAFVKKNLWTDYTLLDNISDKIGLKVKTIDMKIYNRFLNSDVEKCIR